MSEAAPKAQSLLSGGLVMSLAQAVRVVIQFGSTVVLSRLLSPSDFGLYAALSPLLALLAVFQNLGLQHAIVQRSTLEREWLHRAFWTTCLVGAASAALVVALAVPVASFYDEPRLAALTAASSLTVLLTSLATVPIGLLNRQMHFARLAKIDIVGAVSGVSCGIATAVLGFRYWALWIAPLVTALSSLWLSLALTRYRPQGRPAVLVGDGLRFGAHLTGFNLLNYFSRNLDNVLIGRVLGASALGLYDRAYKLLLFPLQNLVTPLSRVMIPTLSRIQNDTARFRDTYLGAVRPLSIVTLPGIAAVAATADEVVVTLFGAPYRDAGPILMWLCIAGIAQPISSTTGWLFVAGGHGQALLRWGAYSSATTLVAFFTGLPYGATGVAMAYACSEWLLRVPALYVVVGRVTAVRAADLLGLQAPFAVASIATFAVCAQLLRPLLSDAPIALCFGTALAAYLLAALCLCVSPAGRATLTRAAELARRILSRWRRDGRATHG